MNITQKFVEKNDCYKNNVKAIDSRYVKFQKNGPKGLMLHSVGCNQPSADAFAKKWNTGGISKCVHAFIDANTGEIVQTLPWNYRGWHAGGSANDTYIGVEMCEPDCIQYVGGASFKILNIDKARIMAGTTYDSAAELFAMLCKQYCLDPLKDICSHSEGYKKGIASGHSDPEHLWRQLGLGYNMDTFRASVKEIMSNGKETPNTTLQNDKEVFYTVKRGDTLSGIARIYGTKWQTIAELNNIRSPFVIHPGDVLRIR